MKKFSLLGLVLIFVQTATFSAISTDSMYETKIGTTVNSGHCTDMKRDHQYSTRSYNASSTGYVYNKTKNCENEPIADGYDGYADILVEKYPSGFNVFHVQDVYLRPGAEKKYYSYTNPYENCVSTTDWEIIDGQNVSGSKRIYASIE